MVTRPLVVESQNVRALAYQACAIAQVWNIGREEGLYYFIEKQPIQLKAWNEFRQQRPLLHPELTIQCGPSRVLAGLPAPLEIVHDLVADARLVQFHKVAVGIV